MKKELVYVALFLSLAVVAVSVVTLLKVYYDDQAYSTPIQEPVSQFFCGTPNPTEEEILGKKIYEINCSPCHAKPTAKHNYLNDITERFGEKFVITYVVDEDSLLKVNDTLALQRNDFWGGNSYTHKFKLTSDEVKAVLRYLEENH